jgi:iron complex outermembrane receptor protein
VASFTIDQSSRQGAVYVQDEIRVRPWLLLNGGLRHDRYQQFARTTPRGAVILIPSPNQSFKYLYGRAFRAPNAYERTLRRRHVVSAAGIDRHPRDRLGAFGERLRTSVSAYRYLASQLITFDLVTPNALVDTFAFRNDGTVRARGVEGEVEVRAQRLQVLGSVALQRAMDEAGATLTNSPREMAKLRLSAPGPFAGSTAAVEVEHLSARRTLAATTGSAATIANLTVNARLAGAFELVGTVRNLFNQRYADPASDEQLPDAIQQNGRTARLGLRWNLWTR